MALDQPVAPRSRRVPPFRLPREVIDRDINGIVKRTSSSACRPMSDAM
jgi:hypothetical protein